MNFSTNFSNRMSGISIKVSMTPLKLQIRISELKTRFSRILKPDGSHESLARPIYVRESRVFLTLEFRLTIRL